MPYTKVDLLVRLLEANTNSNYTILTPSEIISIKATIKEALEIPEEEETKEIIEKLVTKFKEDPEYLTSWQANIEMAFKDAFVSYWDKEPDLQLPPNTTGAIMRLFDNSARKGARNFINLLMTLK